MKRKLFACFLAWTMILTLTACGGSAPANTSASKAAADTAAPSEPEMGYLDANGSDDAAMDGGSDVLKDQKIIHTGSMNLETTEFDAAAQALTELADSLGGYLESSTLGSGGRGYRWGDYTVRVPAAQFQSFLNRAGELAHVTWQSQNLENITETYYDTAGRLKTQQIKLERLQKLLAQAENMEDIITIESAISDTELEIERLTGTLRQYDALVDYATVHLSLQEVYQLSNVEEPATSFASRMGAAFASGWRGFVGALESLAVALAYGWVWLLLLAAVGTVAGRLLWKRRRRERQAASKESENKP